MRWANHPVSDPLRLCRRAIKKCRSLVDAGASLYIVQPRSYLSHLDFFLSHCAQPSPSPTPLPSFSVTLLRPWTSPSIRGHWYTRCHPRARKFVDKTRRNPDVTFKAKVYMKVWNNKLVKGWRANNRVCKNASMYVRVLDCTIHVGIIYDRKQNWFTFHRLFYWLYQDLPL